MIVPFPMSQRRPPLTRNVETCKWRLDATYRVADERNGCILVIPEGYEFDLASSPRVAWGLFAPHDVGTVGPLAHDFLYGGKGLTPIGGCVPWRRYTRAQADTLFFDLMRAEGIAPWRRWLAFLAVRCFGWLAWGGRR